ncbi:MAG: OmpH family outer membrane protein, partial [Flavobacteriaceae bacterium]
MTYIHILLFATALLVSSFSHAQKNVRIGFLDIDKVLESHKGYATSNQELEAKITAWRNEIETKQKELDQQRESLDLERPLLTEEIFEERAEDIAFEQEKLDQYIKKRFGTEGDWVKQKVMLAQPAQDEILTAIKEIADDRNLDYVFDSTADILVLHSEKKYDISDLVIRYIEIEDKKKAQEFLSKTKRDERRQRTNPALEEKRKVLEQRKAERQKLLEERRATRERKKNANKLGSTAPKDVDENRSDEEQRAAR